eukprot:Pgem_evm1s8481
MTPENKEHFHSYEKFNKSTHKRRMSKNEILFELVKQPDIVNNSKQYKTKSSG